MNEKITHGIKTPYFRSSLLLYVLPMFFPLPFARATPLGHSAKMSSSHSLIFEGKKFFFFFFWKKKFFFFFGKNINYFNYFDSAWRWSVFSWQSRSRNPKTVRGRDKSRGSWSGGPCQFPPCNGHTPSKKIKQWVTWNRINFNRITANRKIGIISKR